MIINSSLISLDLEATTKEDAFNKIFAMAQSSGRLSDVEAYKKAVLTREDEFSTDMGFGIALPHGKSSAVIEPFIVFAKLREPILWNEEEKSRVSLVFLLGAPEHTSDNVHLKILSQLAGKLMDDAFIAFLKGVTDKEQVLEYFKDMKL